MRSSSRARLVCGRACDNCLACIYSDVRVWIIVLQELIHPLEKLDTPPQQTEESPPCPKVLVAREKFVTCESLSRRCDTGLGIQFFLHPDKSG